MYKLTLPMLFGLHTKRTTKGFYALHMLRPLKWVHIYDNAVDVEKAVNVYSTTLFISFFYNVLIVVASRFHEEFSIDLNVLIVLILAQLPVIYLALHFLQSSRTFHDEAVHGKILDPYAKRRPMEADNGSEDNPER